MTVDWSPGWRARLLVRLREHGFATVHEMLQARDGRSYEEITRELGEEFAQAQVVTLHLSEGIDRGVFLEAAAECLARNLIGRLARGWNTGPRADYRIASSLAAWAGDVLSKVAQTILNEEDVDRIISALIHSVRPPDGWLPKNGHDPLIQEAFRIGRLQEADGP